jgi:hypothetical protein
VPYPKCAFFAQDTGHLEVARRCHSLQFTLVKSVYLQTAVDVVGCTVTHIVWRKTGLSVPLSPQVTWFLIRAVETGQIPQLRHPLEQTGAGPQKIPTTDGRYCNV